MRGGGRLGSRVGIRLVTGAFLLVAVALIALGTAVRGTRTPTVGTPLLGGPHIGAAGSRFAGYRDQVDLTSIGADWRVPALASHSRLGVASTWIGAQGPGGGGTPFIQVGTEEDMAPTGADGLLAPAYEAFFSDTRRNFRPDPLFAVGAGDEITATMQLRDDRWRVVITDATTGRRRTLDTTQEGQGIFLFAEWTQEDATDARTNGPEPYPDLSATQMTALTVDHHAPSYANLESTWMELPGGYLGPTALDDDAFSVTPRKLTAPGAEYLRIIHAVDAAGSRFDAQAGTWRAGTPPATIKQETGLLTSALASADVSLRRYRWPASAIHQIDLLVGNQAYQAAHLPAAAQESGAAVARVLSRAQRAYPVNPQRLRRELGVEEVVQ
jgi:hypothetical protein